MSLFLDKKEIELLTEFSQPARQISELRRRGIPFLVSRRGKPQVLRQVLLEIGGVKSRSKPDETINIEALEAIIHGQKKKH